MKLLGIEKIFHQTFVNDYNIKIDVYIHDDYIGVVCVIHDDVITKHFNKDLNIKDFNDYCNSIK